MERHQAQMQTFMSNPQYARLHDAYAKFDDNRVRLITKTGQDGSIAFVVGGNTFNTIGEIGANFPILAQVLSQPAEYLADNWAKGDNVYRKLQVESKGGKHGENYSMSIVNHLNVMVRDYNKLKKYEDAFLNNPQDHIRESKFAGEILDGLARFENELQTRMPRLVEAYRENDTLAEQALEGEFMEIAQAYRNEFPEFFTYELMIELLNKYNDEALSQSGLQ